MYRTIYENIYQRSSQTVDIWGKKSISEINRYESAG